MPVENSANNKELDQYLASTPKSRALWEEGRNYLPGGDSRNSIFWEPYPLFIESGSGCRVVDADGVERLDFINTMTSLILGHSPSPVVESRRRTTAEGSGLQRTKSAPSTLGPPAMPAGPQFRLGTLH